MTYRIGQFVHFSYDSGDVNYHGPDHSTLRRAWKIVRMGSYAKTWKLYVYRGDGSWMGFSVCFPKWRGPWPESAGNEPRRAEEPKP